MTQAQAPSTQTCSCKRGACLLGRDGTTAPRSAHRHRRHDAHRRRAAEGHGNAAKNRTANAGGEATSFQPGNSVMRGATQNTWLLMGYACIDAWGGNYGLRKPSYPEGQHFTVGDTADILEGAGFNTESHLLPGAQPADAQLCRSCFPPSNTTGSAREWLQ